MKGKFLAVIIQMFCVLTGWLSFSTPSAATVYDSFYLYNGPAYPLSCTGTASICLQQPSVDSVQVLLDFYFDTSGLSGTFLIPTSVSGSPPLPGSIFAVLQDAVFGITNGVFNATGSVTLTAGQVTAWSISGDGSLLHRNWTVSTSNAGDSSTFLIEGIFIDPTLPPGSASGGGSGPSGVWSDVGHNYITPLPAALPLFATSLGALGLLGWRRKRKQAA